MNGVEEITMTKYAALQKYHEYRDASAKPKLTHTGRD